MVLEGTSTLARYEGNKTMIYIPSGVVSDSQFPLEPGEEVRVRIDSEEGRLIVEPAATEDEDST